MLRDIVKHVKKYGMFYKADFLNLVEKWENDTGRGGYVPTWEEVAEVLVNEDGYYHMSTLFADVLISNQKAKDLSL